MCALSRSAGCSEGQSPEHGFAAGERHPQRVERQALAEAARAGPEIMVALLDRAPHDGGGIDLSFRDTGTGGRIGRRSARDVPLSCLRCPEPSR